eukprot:Blabericola_migrator_1__576@NODE_1142_length_5300_cov_104_746990_g777_i0_p4_GENE_NODE_1142_length_5300_cov_104_746990_g777_i0NODE_1142_length_5300_cov_104_746990_g777_i0_p4_ORF_typecomplete_len134_score13_37_NODE_1142_length_5300_cov_104_746990_g777_i023152716
MRVSPLTLDLLLQGCIATYNFTGWLKETSHTQTKISPGYDQAKMVVWAKTCGTDLPCVTLVSNQSGISETVSTVQGLSTTHPVSAHAPSTGDVSIDLKKLLRTQAAKRAWQSAGPLSTYTGDVVSVTVQKHVP